MKAKEFMYIMFKSAKQVTVVQWQNCPGIKAVVDSSVGVMNGEFETLQDAETSIVVTSATHSYPCKKKWRLQDSVSKNLKWWDLWN